mgnify:CR=1 FL=1
MKVTETTKQMRDAITNFNGPFRIQEAAEAAKVNPMLMAFFIGKECKRGGHIALSHQVPKTDLFGNAGCFSYFKLIRNF